ncbi:MAG: hypothetical protein WC981_03565 [Candidatus Dojkabacteria bacterium]
MRTEAIIPPRVKPSEYSLKQVTEAFNHYKYIIVLNEDLGPIAFTFPNYLSHSHVKYKLFPTSTILSAGYYTLNKDLTINVIGKSDISNISNRPDSDPSLISKALGIQGPSHEQA